MTHAAPGDSPQPATDVSHWYAAFSSTEKKWPIWAENDMYLTCGLDLWL